ncbi:MAG TPA: bifunctional tetrahydrofolate synthase/dihydrofolate synthase [Thiomicrospira sp.]|jgi:dihydrofolate synthase/folylpolyglutamate synthase|nr:bifunctional tetrahydrofolate synthase/dihydrofolate synthase [Thiomicrospira sp.]
MTIPNNQSNLNTWVDWLLHLHAEEIDLGLERIRLVANSMQVTRPAPIVISVAGTNGKGSSVAMLASILKEAGYHVGTYTSPHILTFNERIQINGVPVEDQVIVDAFNLIEQQRKDIKLTYFEFSTLAALTIFNQSKLDVVVLEVGLGGRLDAVNVVDADAALITAIDVDHIDWLGDDRNVIAVEKAGIMRANKLAVCSDPQPPQTLLDYAKGLGVDLLCLNHNFSYHGNAATNDDWCFKTSVSDISKDTEVLEFVKPALKGQFQLQNAAGVVALLHNLTQQLPVTEEAINQGLKKVQHAGRMQELTVNNQAWLIDVAHNPQSAKVLAEHLSSCSGKENKKVAIFSALNDKDMVPMVQNIAPFVSQWFIADLSIPRSTSTEALLKTLTAAGAESQRIIECDSISDAVKKVVELDKQDVLVWGSFFTVSQSLEALESVNGVER